MAKPRFSIGDVNAFDDFAAGRRKPAPELHRQALCWQLQRIAGVGISGFGIISTPRTGLFTLDRAAAEKAGNRRENFRARRVSGCAIRSCVSPDTAARR